VDRFPAISGRSRSVLLLAALAGLGAVLSVAATASEPAPLRASVVGVSGDALVVRLASGERERVRLLGTVIPAAGACFAGGARAELRRLALGRRVTLAGDAARPRRDRSGRLAAYVRLPDGVDLGRRLIDGGFAQVDLRGGFGRFLAYVPVQRLSERTVSGMWRECAADLAITLDGPRTAVVGEQVAYTVTVTNAGPLPARAAVVDLRPPAAARLVALESETGACASRDWLASCSFAELPAGGSVTARLVLEARAAGLLSTRAAVRFSACAAAACGRAPLHDAELRNDETAALTTILTAPPPPAPGQPPPPPSAPSPACHPSYPDTCIPPPPPDLDCADIPFRDFQVRRDGPDADPHILDGNEDGVGCQFDDY
jgi:endonuclease YncB( thermonuclease family)